MSTRIKQWALVAVLAALAAAGTAYPPSLDSQNVINTTTLSAAITSTSATQIRVTSASGAAVNDIALVNKEKMQVTAISGTLLTVRRGVDGTAAATHGSGDVIFIDSPSFFTTAVRAGTCTASATNAAPAFTGDGRVYDCSNGRWVERVTQPVTFAAATTITGRQGCRDSFDQGYLLIMDTGVVTAFTDDLDTFVYGSPCGAIEFREELTKTASSWVTAAGRLDLSADDTTDDEGVEIIVGASELNGAAFVAGTTGMCVSASITLTDISGTDQLLIGFRDSSAFLDVNNYAGYTIWNVVGVNAVDGSIVSLQEVSEATDSDDSGVNFADGETRGLKVCVSAAGVPSAFYSAAATLGSQAELYPTWLPITMTETGSTLTAAQAMVPFITYMAAGTDGADPFVNWVQLEPHR